MDEGLVARRSRVMAGAGPIALSLLIVDAGAAAAERFLKFFAAQIANERDA